MKDQIKHYPVGNGDTTLLKLKDSTTLLIDCHFRGAAENGEDDSTFDVKKDILENIGDDGERYELDVFINSHADKDHCGGFRKHFYCGDPKNYEAANYDLGEILIGELWATSMLFTNEQSRSANALRYEAIRRRRLYDEKDPLRFDHGNRLVIVGYDGDQKLENVPHYHPGETVSIFNGKSQSTFSMFIHSPFKDTLVECRANKDRNSASIIFQARFLGKVGNADPVCRLMMGGDADHCQWEQVLIKSKKHNNEAALKWDIWLAVHHCSWTFFNDVPYNAREENKTPKQYSLDLLGYGIKGGYVIASSKAIIDNDDNPPHFKAREEYLDKVDSGHFLNTAVHPSEEKPEPIVFEIGEHGYAKSDTSVDIKRKKEAAAVIASRSIVKGNWCNDGTF